MLGACPPRFVSSESRCCPSTKQAFIFFTRAEQVNLPNDSRSVRVSEKRDLPIDLSFPKSARPRWRNMNNIQDSCLPTAPLEARHISTSTRQHVGDPDQFGPIGKASLSLCDPNRVLNLTSRFLCVSIPEQFGLGTVSGVPLTKPMLSASQILFLVGFSTKCRFRH